MPFESLAGRRFALLTTSRRNGVAVPTPVWVVVDEHKAWVISRGPGKVKRIRNNPAVEIGPCTMRGRPRGEAERGVARILDGDPPASVCRALRRKYGPMPTISRRLAKVFRKPLWVVEIAAPMSAEPHADIDDRDATVRRQRPLRARSQGSPANAD